MLFVSIVVSMEINRRHYFRSGPRNMAHAYGTLDNQGCRHTLRICNAYCFSVATMDKRTCLCGALYVHCYLVLSTCNSCLVLRWLLVNIRFSSYLPVCCFIRCYNLLFHHYFHFPFPFHFWPSSDFFLFRRPGQYSLRPYLPLLI